MDGLATAHEALLSVSEVATAAVQTKQLDTLATDAKPLLELSPAWRSVSEVLLAVVAQRQGDEKPLLELSQRVRSETKDAKVGSSRDNRVFVL